MTGLIRLDGFKLWTHPAPDRSAAVVSVLPSTLDIPKLLAALYEKDKIAVAGRNGADRGGLRISPHFCNTPDEIDRLVGALAGYARTGV